MRRFIGWTHYFRGDGEAALEAMRSQAELLESDMYVYGVDLGDLCLLYALLGQAEEARGVLDENRDLLPKMGEANLMGSWELACSAAEAMALVGAPEESAALYPAVAQVRAGGVVMTYSMGLVERILGIAAACEGRWDRAEGHFETALQEAHELVVS